MKPDYTTKLTIVRLLTISREFNKLQTINGILCYEGLPLNVENYYITFQEQHSVYVDKSLFINTLIEIGNSRKG